MDPYEGDVKHAIVVHCNMEIKATCVFAKPEMSQEFTYQRRARGIVWLGDETCPGYEVGIFTGPPNYLLSFCVLIIFCFLFI